MFGTLCAVRCRSAHSCHHSNASAGGRRCAVILCTVLFQLHILALHSWVIPVILIQYKWRICVQYLLCSRRKRRQSRKRFEVECDGTETALENECPESRQIVDTATETETTESRTTDSSDCETATQLSGDTATYSYNRTTSRQRKTFEFARGTKVGLQNYEQQRAF